MAWVNAWDVHAQDHSPVILIVDATSPQVIAAVDFAAAFMASNNPVSIITTCPSIPATQPPTQDVSLLHIALTTIRNAPMCETTDHAQAFQQAVTQMGTQSGDILYLIDGPNLTTGSTVTTSDAMKSALAQVRDHNICLYVIPIGDPNLANSASGAIDRDLAQDLINRTSCGERYTPQTIHTLANTLLQATLTSQDRILMTTTGEQLSLFDRSTARLKQAIPVSEDVSAVRIDVVWGKGEVQVALQPPNGAAPEPTIISGEGYRSFLIADPAPGAWNVVLSVVDVPDNQVGVVLFSQGENQTGSVSPTIIPTIETVPAITTAPQVTITTAKSVATSETIITADITPSTAISPSSAPRITAINTSQPTTETTLEPFIPQETASINTDPTLTLLIAIGSFVLLLVIGLGSWLFWRPQKNAAASAANPSTKSIFHSRTTSEMPPVEIGSLSSRVTETLPVAPPNKIAPPSFPVDTQFRQFPALLMFINGPQRGQFIDIDTSHFTIGRHSSSRLRIQDVTISREHALILFDNAQNLYRIENISKAGTQINGHYVAQSQPLYNGDVIQIGVVQMQFQLRLPTSM